MGQKLYLIYNMTVAHEMEIDDIVKICADCGHSPINPTIYNPKYHSELWSSVDIDKIKLEAMSRCDGVVLCDNSELSQDWMHCAERMQMDIYTIWNVKEWERKMEI
jgi:hypothetical protein